MYNDNLRWKFFYFFFSCRRCEFFGALLPHLSLMSKITYNIILKELTVDVFKVCEVFLRVLIASRLIISQHSIQTKPVGTPILCWTFGKLLRIYLFSFTKGLRNNHSSFQGKSPLQAKWSCIFTENWSGIFIIVFCWYLLFLLTLIHRRVKPSPLKLCLNCIGSFTNMRKREPLSVKVRAPFSSPRTLNSNLID